MEVSRPLSRQAWHSRSRLIRSRSRPPERSPSVACVCATRLRLGTCSGNPVGREPQTCSRSAPRDAGCGVRARPPPTVWFEPCVRVSLQGGLAVPPSRVSPFCCRPEIPPQRHLPSPNRAGPRRPEGTSSKGVNRSRWSSHRQSTVASDSARRPAQSRRRISTARGCRPAARRPRAGARAVPARASHDA